MRWFAPASISLALLGAVFGCGGADHPGILAPPEDGGAGGRSEHGGSGGAAAAGKSGAATGDGGSDSAGASSAGDRGEAGSPVAEGGSAGADESAAGSAQGGNAGGAVVPTIPKAPSGLGLQVLGASSVHLAWTDNANNETGFKVYWSATADKPATANAILGPDVVSTTVDGLTVNQAYNFWIEAYDDVGTSAAITGSATPLPVPAQPTGLVASANATDVVLTWNDLATGETGYRIFFSTDDKPATAQHEIPANSTTITLTGDELAQYTKYTIWVEAYNAVGDGAPATATATTGILPLTPVGVTVDQIDKYYYITVSWQDYSDSQTGYNIYWSTDDTKPAAPGAVIDATAKTYEMTKVFGGQYYRFWIETVNAIGTSAAAKGTAPNNGPNSATYDQMWTDLYYDLNSNTVREAVQDTFGYTSDPASANTNIYGYHNASTTLGGTAALLNPGINWPNGSFDPAVTQYFWSELRNPGGSTFSVRSLVPPSPAASPTVTPGQLTATAYWAASTNAPTYQLFKGTSTAFASATLSNTTSAAPTSAAPITISDLNPGTQYSFWVRALGAGLNGTGFPSLSPLTTVITSGTSIGPNLALGKTAVSLSDTADAKNVVDGNTGTRWQAATTNVNEWIYVNLGNGNAVPITDVKLVWENAYAKSFEIQVCDATCDDNAAVTADNWAWVSVYTSPSTTLTGFPNYQLVHLPTPVTTSQFVRMRQKTTAQINVNYGSSLYEFEVFSAP